MIKEIIDRKILLEELYTLYRPFATTPLFIEGATNIVFGEGDPYAPLLFIGEAPGAEEDAQARPFVGRSGRLLTKTLATLGIQRSQVFITNIVKCRPPNNRVPLPHEIQAGIDLVLRHEIAIIQPKVIVTLGASSLSGLLQKPISMGKVRGTIIEEAIGTIMPIFHPAFILRNSSLLPLFQEDIARAAERSGLI